MTTIAKALDTRWPDAGPDFNHAAAAAVFDTVMGMEDGEARVFAGMLHGAIIQRDAACYSTAIAKALDEYYTGQLLEVSQRLMEGAIAKAARGGDAQAELYALDLIAKAGETSEQRAEAARKQRRDLLTGQFVREHKPISHDEGPPLSRAQAGMLGIADPGVKLNGRQLANFQRGYHGVAQMLEQYSELPAQDAVLHFHYSDGETSLASPVRVGGNLKVPIKQVVDQRGTTVVKTPGLDPHKRLTAVSLSVKPDLSTTAGAYQRAFAAAGMPGVGRAAYSVVDPDSDIALGNPDAWDPENSGSFGDRWTRTIEGDEFTPSRRAFRRLSTGSAALADTLGPTAPPKLKIALKVGQHVGELGPEAQKVIGPTADRAAYRYRGIEREPDRRLTLAVENVMNRPGLNGMGKHNLLFHGSEDEQGNWRASAPMSYLRTRLPSAALNTLQRMSGHIPPSEGFIISPAGKVTAQAVGYGDDHYLPFNLKKLGGLRGGEYMRTRTWGGPTTEDIYTGLIGGARTLSVVSHNGVYTLEFDDNLKGGRRFNDKAARMVARYGQLLDAVRSEQVTTGGLAASRLAELETQANQRYDQDQEPERYDQELDRLKTAERKRPTLSAQQRAEAGNEFFTELAGRRQTPDGHEMSAADLADDFVSQRATEQYQRDGVLLAQMQADGGAAGAVRISHAERKAQILASLDSPNPVIAQQNLADAMGVRRQYDASMKRAESTLKDSLTPLALNGQGYEAALTALQEQFPYYIKSAKFYPWEDARNGHDTGYVRPRHNRPAAALAGYFDPNVTGHGKVTADSTRFQNYGVRRGKLEHVSTSDERRAAVREKIRASSGGTAGEPVRADDTLSRLATDRVIDHLHNLTHFKLAAGTTDAQRAALSGSTIAGHAALGEIAGKVPDLHRLLTTDPYDFRQQVPEPAERKRIVERALAQNKTFNLVDVDPTIERTFRTGGLAEAPKRIGENAAETLTTTPGTIDFDFEHLGPAYSADRQPGIDSVLDTYTADSRIQALVHRGDLPATLANPQQVTDALRTTTAKINADYQKRASWDALDARGRAPLGPQPPRMADINEQAEGVLRARQLARRYTEAVNRQEVGREGDQIVVVQSGDASDAFLRRIGIDGDVSPTIGYTPEGRHIR